MPTPNHNIESLEDRRLLTTTPIIATPIAPPVNPAITAATAQLKATTTTTTTTTPTKAAAPTPLDAATARLRAQAAFFNASDAALNKAIAQLNAAALAATTESGLRLIVADGLNLPPEALKTNLSAADLVKHVGELQIDGGQDQQSSPAYWQTVATKGADAALAGVVVANLGIPPAAVAGKTAKQILDGAGNIQLMTGDVRSAQAWQGLALVQSGKISVEQFASQFTAGTDIAGKTAAPAKTTTTTTAPKTNTTTNTQNVTNATAAKDAANTGVGTRSANTTVTNTTTGGAASNTTTTNNTNVNTNTAVNTNTSVNTGGAANTTATTGAAAGTTTQTTTAGTTTSNMPAVTNTAPNTDTNVDAAADTTVTGQHTGTITNVNNTAATGDSSYTLTETFPDGSSQTYQVTVHPDGSATMTDQDGNTATLPPDSADPMPDSAEGQTINMDQDTNGDGQADSGTYYPPSDDDGTDTGNDDDNKDNNDSGNNNGNPDNNEGLANPDADTSDPNKRNNFYNTNPIGQSQGAGTTSRTNPATDPTDPSTNTAARNAFYNSPLGGGGPGLRVPGGTVDYPDSHTATRITIDSQTLKSLQIKAGGATGGPNAGQPAPTPSSVAPTKPITGTTAVSPFSTTRITTSALTATATLTAKISTAVVTK